MQVRSFGREQFHKVEDEPGVEMLLKMAAMEEIKKAAQDETKQRISIAHQLVCSETMLVHVQKNLVTGEVEEMQVQIDGLRPSANQEEENHDTCKSDPFSFFF